MTDHRHIQEDEEKGLFKSKHFFLRKIVFEAISWLEVFTTHVLFRIFQGI